MGLARFRTRPETDGGDDRGSALVMALAVTVLGGLVALPLLNYGASVSRAGRVVSDKALHIEAAKAGTRVALADPASLYQVCDAAGITVGVVLPSPDLDAGVTTTCYKMDETTSTAEGAQRIGATTTLVGSSVPTGLFGDPYPGSGGTPADAWQNDATTDAIDGKIWMPDLPGRALNIRSASGHLMPTGFATCRVFFPGTYTDNVVLTSSTPTYFASGTYYFTKQLRISGNADVVFGAGAKDGCTTDQEAAFYAIDAPSTHQISGMGAVIVLGDQGRLVVDTATTGTRTSLVMNRRYVAPQDVAALPAAGVSIMTVNGSLSGGVSSNLELSGNLDVPKSMVGGATPTLLEDSGYTPSTLIPGTATPSAVVQVDLTDSRTVVIDIPGYISIPQGTISVNTNPAAAATAKDVTINGGVLAAQMTVSATRPASLEMGLVNPIVQRLFRITSVSTGGPGAVANALVQINENGAYAVNSWEVQ